MVSSLNDVVQQNQHNSRSIRVNTTGKKAVALYSLSSIRCVRSRGAGSNGSFFNYLAYFSNFWKIQSFNFSKIWKIDSFKFRKIERLFLSKFRKFERMNLSKFQKVERLNLSNFRKVERLRFLKMWCLLSCEPQRAFTTRSRAVQYSSLRINLSENVS